MATTNVNNVVRLNATNDLIGGALRIQGIAFVGGGNTITLQDNLGNTVLVSSNNAAGTTQYLPLSTVFPTGLLWSAGAAGTVVIFLQPPISS